MAMRLNDPLKNTIDIEGKSYEVNMAFDVVLDVLDVLSDKRLFPENKIEIIIKLFFGTDTDLPPVYWLSVWKRVKEEWIDGPSKQPIEYDILGNPMPQKHNARTIDFEYDAKYIYASFRQIGINLFEEQGKMHWEEFQALLEALPENTIIQRIRDIRSQEYTGLSSKQKAKLRELKKRYALPGEEVEDG